MSQNNKAGGISKTLRTLTDAEKISFYKGRGHKAADMTHVEANGQTRSWTEAEFEDHILEHMPHPDIYEQDLSYIGKRREEYPDEVEQMDAIWKMVAHLKANGTDIGTDAQAMLDIIEAAKVKYPKPAALT